MTVNTSGMQPIEYKVLVKPHDPLETDEQLKSATKSGILLPPTEREAAAQVKGVLIAKGGIAFHDFGDIRPEIGDVVYYAKYSGLVIKGDDGVEYRLMNDKDVAAIVIGQPTAA